MALGFCFQWVREVVRFVIAASPWRRADARLGFRHYLFGGHDGVDLLLRVPVLWLGIDGAPPLRSIAKPFGSQFGVARDGIVVPKLGPT